MCNLKMAAVKLVWQCMFSPRLHKIYDDRRPDVSVSSEWNLLIFSDINICVNMNCVFALIFG